MTPPTRTATTSNLCARCQAVCCRLTVVLHADDHIPDHLTDYSPEGLHVMKRAEDGWCVALDRTRMNCGIYDTRPTGCRRFVMGGPYCKAIRADFDRSGRAGMRHDPSA